MDNTFNKFIGLILDNRYKLLASLGTGGMSNVFLANDLVDGTPKAIKMLKDNIANDPVALKRLISESKAYAMLNHPHIVKIYDISVKGEYKYLVMEYVNGITLKKYMKEKGPLDWKEVVDYTLQILEALEVAHNIPFIHRDIKPQNIMLMQGGFVKVIDFGIAKLPDASTLTAVDKAIGTVFYISPEQATGAQAVDARSDIYSLGITMYEMVTGKLPFISSQQQQIIYKHVSEPPTPPSRYVSSIPKGLEQIILCAIEKKPIDRYQSAAQMSRHLKRLLENPNADFSKAKSPIEPIDSSHFLSFTSTVSKNGIDIPPAKATEDTNYSFPKKKEKKEIPAWLYGLVALGLGLGVIVGLVILFANFFASFNAYSCSVLPAPKL